VVFALLPKANLFNKRKSFLLALEKQSLLTNCSAEKFSERKMLMRATDVRNKVARWGESMAAAATTSLSRCYPRILVASADPSFRKRLMERPGYMQAFSEEAVGGAHALAKLAHFSCDNVLLDRNLPDLDSSEVAEIIRERYPQIDVQFVDSHEGEGGSAETETELTSKNGLSAAIPDDAHETETQAISVVSESSEALPGMLGASRAIQRLYRLARMVAPRDTTVLITGETGTGKELVAHAIHKLSPRAMSPFVVVNCAAIPEALFEAELFGHARGAFTGAVQSRVGRIHAAQGGTLFLDEIGELPLSMQAKLLRFLQNGEVQRLGSSEVSRVDVRVVCATNVNLQDHVQAKLFRPDLYYRLAIFPLAIPSLRERTGDISVLSAYFLARLSAENSIPCKYLTASALALLQRAHWEGNVRQLEHAIERAFILSGEESSVGVEHLQHFGDRGQLREV
jgi:DNA-binding NtrC family response regulator